MTAGDFYGESAAIALRPKTAPPTRSHLKTLRELRAARKNKNENTTVSIQQKKKVEDAHTYLAVNVDPIFSKAITYILIEQPTPDALLRTLLNYFNNLVAGNEIKPTSAEKQQRKVQSTDKLFMAKALSPVFTKLINMALALRPDDVPCFVVDTLNDMIKEQEERELKLAEEELKASNEKIAAANAGKGEASDNGNDNEKRESRITPKEEGSVNEAVAEEAAVEKVYPKKMVVLVLGIENSGKSTLLKVVQGDEDPKMAPTVGFNPASLKLGKSTVQFYDIGGGPKIRDIWSSYYHDVHGIIYVVDSASDDMKFAEACEVAKTTLSHQYLAGKPLLFLCNKAEAPAARDVEEIKDDMDLVVPPGGNVLCTSITLHPQHTQDKGMDPRIDSSLEWLFDCVAGDFENIKARVESDCQLEKEKQEEEKRQKDRRVLRKSISKGFGLGGEEVEDAFSKEDGEEFLAQEIGFMKAEELEDEGKEVAELVGYQKLALMMIGGMFAPISSKKKKYTWAEIKAHVMEIRAEVGL